MNEHHDSNSWTDHDARWMTNIVRVQKWLRWRDPGLGSAIDRLSENAVFRFFVFDSCGRTKRYRDGHGDRSYFRDTIIHPIAPVWNEDLADGLRDILRQTPVPTRDVEDGLRAFSMTPRPLIDLFAMTERRTLVHRLLDYYVVGSLLPLRLQIAAAMAVAMAILTPIAAVVIWIYQMDEEDQLARVLLSDVVLTSAELFTRAVLWLGLVYGLWQTFRAVFRRVIEDRLRVYALISLRARLGGRLPRWIWSKIVVAPEVLCVTLSLCATATAWIVVTNKWGNYSWNPVLGADQVDILTVLAFALLFMSLMSARLNRPSFDAAENSRAWEEWRESLNHEYLPMTPRHSETAFTATGNKSDRAGRLERLSG